MYRVVKANYTPEDGYWYLFRHGSGPGTIPNDVSLLDSCDHPTNRFKFYGKLDRFLTTDELRQYDLKEEMPPKECMSHDDSIDSLSYAVEAYTHANKGKKIDLDKIANELWDAMSQWIHNSGEGFSEDDDSWKDYTHVSVKVDNDDDGQIICRVSSEYLADYDAMMDATEQYLDKVVMKYDKYAYFDAEDTGICVAVIMM